MLISACALLKVLMLLKLSQKVKSIVISLIFLALKSLFNNVKKIKYRPDHYVYD
jgi:hypothetical protein